MKKVVIAGFLAVAAFFISGAAHAEIVQQTNAWSQVATNDANVTFYLGTTTAAWTVQDVGVFISSSDLSGVDMQIRLTCFANTWDGSQAGCTNPAALTTATTTVYNTAGQVIYFRYTTPVQLQAGKVYVMEIMESYTQSTSFTVYGDTVLQFAGQCTPAFLGSPECSGAPYWTFNAVPDWTGINATSTALTALYGNSATDTLNLIQTRCVRDGLIDFGYAMCSAFAYLFIPDPQLVNSYSQSVETARTKFPMSWYYGIKSTYESLTASSTPNMAAVSINFSAVDPATTTPFGNILPNAAILSSTTISTYLTPSMLSTLLALETAALWIAFALFIFFDVQRRLFRH